MQNSNKSHASEPTPEPTKTGREEVVSFGVGRVRWSECLTVAFCVGAIVFGLSSLGCGGAQPAPAGQPEPEVHTPTPVGVEPGIIRFADDLAQIEVALNMAPHTREVDGEVQETGSVVVNDWFIHLFEASDGKILIGEEELDERVVFWLEHRYFEAEMAVFSVPETGRNIDRFLDVAAEEEARAILRAADLMSAVENGAASEMVAGLILSETVFGGRKAVEVIGQRTNSETQVKEVVHVIVLRQAAEQGNVLLIVALRARQSDYTMIVPEMSEMFASIRPSGTGVASKVSPTRVWGRDGDAYNADWSFLDPPVEESEPIELSYEAYGAYFGAIYGMVFGDGVGSPVGAEGEPAELGQPEDSDEKPPKESTEKDGQKNDPDGSSKDENHPRDETPKAPPEPKGTSTTDDESDSGTETKKKPRRGL